MPPQSSGGAAPGNADSTNRLARRPHLLQPESQLPVVAVVVDITQYVARFLQRFVEPYGGRSHSAFVPVLDVERTQEELALLVERPTAEGEPVQVVVGPAEGRLQHLVDDVERDVGPDLEPTPDGWVGIVEIDPQPVDHCVSEGSASQTGPSRVRRRPLRELGQVTGELPEVGRVHA